MAYSVNLQSRKNLLLKKILFSDFDIFCLLHRNKSPPKWIKDIIFGQTLI